MADQTKYGRGSTDSTAAVTSQQQQPGSGNVLQQQQQHLAAHFMNYPAYGFYSPMYQMPTGFSAPHNVSDGSCDSHLTCVELSLVCVSDTLWMSLSRWPPSLLLPAQI